MVVHASRDPSTVIIVHTCRSIDTHRPVMFDHQQHKLCSSDQCDIPVPKKRAVGWNSSSSIPKRQHTTKDEILGERSDACESRRGMLGRLMTFIKLVLQEKADKQHLEIVMPLLLSSILNYVYVYTCIHKHIYVSVFKLFAFD